MAALATEKEVSYLSSENVGRPFTAQLQFFTYEHNKYPI